MKQLRWMMIKNLVYFDNSSTTRKKPKEVLDAYNYYVNEVGVSPARGCYELAINASKMLFQARRTVKKFFGCSDEKNIVFTKNSTEAINLLLNGFLNSGNHVLLSPYEHNAVLRPVHALAQTGKISYSILPEEVFYSNDFRLFDRYVCDKTKLIIMTLASNLTGQIVFSKALAKRCNELGIKVFLDASQGAGKKLVNMSTDNIDFLAFTSHKDLLSVPGAGGLCSIEEMKFKPLLQGGTGIYGHEFINPQIYPDSLEAGTLNMPAIWALKAAIEFIERNSSDIEIKEKNLLYYLLKEIRKIRGIKLYNEERQRVPTLAFNIAQTQTDVLVDALSRAGICVRGGVHCAILAHKLLGTEKQGAIRVSLNYDNTIDEINYFIEVLGKVKQ